MLFMSPAQPSDEAIHAIHDADCPQPGEMDTLDAILLGPDNESSFHIHSSSGNLPVRELPTLLNRRGCGGGGHEGIGSTISILEPSEVLAAGNGGSRAVSKAFKVSTMLLAEESGIPHHLGEETDLEDEAEGEGEDEEVQVWHEITAKPFVHPTTGQRAILLMQSDVTTRVKAENILAGLSEGQVCPLDRCGFDHLSLVYRSGTTC
jgi:hypothetical protein